MCGLVSLYYFNLCKGLDKLVKKEIEYYYHIVHKIPAFSWDFLYINLKENSFIKELHFK